MDDLSRASLMKQWKTEFTTTLTRSIGDNIEFNDLMVIVECSSQCKMEIGNGILGIEYTSNYLGMTYLEPH